MTSLVIYVLPIVLFLFTFNQLTTGSTILSKSDLKKVSYFFVFISYN